jgi:hypothetical protein
MGIPRCSTRNGYVIIDNYERVLAKFIKNKQFQDAVNLLISDPKKSLRMSDRLYPKQISDFVDVLLQAKVSFKLIELRLLYMTDKEAVHVARLIASDINVKKIDLSGNCIEANGLKLIGSALYHNQYITRLYLTGGFIDDSERRPPCLYLVDDKIEPISACKYTSRKIKFEFWMNGKVYG